LARDRDSWSGWDPSEGSVGFDGSGNRGWETTGPADNLGWQTAGPEPEKQRLAIDPAEAEKMRPSELASAVQRSADSYGNADAWTDRQLETEIWVGAPGRSEFGAFAIPDADLDYHENDAQAIWSSLQTASRGAKFPETGGDGRSIRPTLEKYRVVGDPIDVAFALDTRANPQHGEGGRTQAFVPNFEQLVKDGRLVRVETRDLYNNYARQE
jgi:hypothetical protein